MAAEYDKRNEEYKKMLADAFIAKISGRGFGYVEDVYAEILDLAEKHAE
ncbi:hypothetical protein [Mameliella alba]|uniref:Uncharacterized protein n=1 Tax=Mameliella alba TaxID=561184 RepID=A0A0B3SMN6_9RHOB|nr:hypothetical protein [Mameliella alba]KHQ51799.1 hypothetical protein OA50_03701 [Mameliella alba]MBY6121114.1 hypothetical protein [Mameliella alba]